MSKQKIVSYAWIFDVDGVITDIETKQITKLSILEEIIKKLKKGEPVALVSGRSLEWLVDRVVRFLKEKTNSHLLRNLIIIGEKGGTWASFDKGQIRQDYDRTLKVPRVLTNQVKQLVEEKFSDVMFLDESKQTMVSVEMKDNVAYLDFKTQQKRLDSELWRILDEIDLLDKFRLDSVRISTDVDHIAVDKSVAAKRALNSIKERGLIVEKFIVFGDVISDVRVADEIYSQGHHVEFVFVGEPKQITDRNFSYPVTITRARLEKGTLEYLTSH